MNYRQKYLSACLLGIAALLGGASPTFAADAPPSLGAASSFAVLSAAPGGGGAVTCTRSIIIGDVGSSGLPDSVVHTSCKITGAVIAPVPAPVLNDFNSAYDQYADIPCTGTLNTAYTNETLTLTPGVYCNSAGVTFTNTTLILVGSPTGTWLFKIGTSGTSGTGALTGTNFLVLMANGALTCNVYWWVAQAATLTDSFFKGTILAGTAITTTGKPSAKGTFQGRALAKAAVTLTDVAFVGCEGGTSNPPRQRCNQGVGNGPEGCDPGNSNQGLSPFRSNDEQRVPLGNPGSPGSPGRQGGNK